MRLDFMVRLVDDAYHTFVVELRNRMIDDLDVNNLCSIIYM